MNYELTKVEKLLRGEKKPLVLIKPKFRFSANGPCNKCPLEQLGLKGAQGEVFSDITRKDKEDPKAKKLFKEASALYKEANKLYLSGKHKYEYIQIFSGKRSSRSQARLFVKYAWHQYGGPKANKANPPGKSFHEYGVAIDIIRGNDTRALKKALESAGWRESVEDEGWHFEAQSIDSWNMIVKKMMESTFPLGEEYRKAISDFLNKRKLCIELWPSYAKQLSRLRPERESLERRRQELVRTEKQLRDERTDLRRKREAATRSSQLASQLQRKYNEMRYTYCPANPPADYEDCTHKEQTSRYDRERAELRREISEARRKANLLRNEYRLKLKKYESNLSRYKSDLKKYRIDIDSWKEKNDKFLKLENRIENVRKGMKTLKRTQSEILRNIDHSIQQIVK
ncbi:D-alanyl-D-alanine carboxypeptidase family protein [Porticoccus sp. W117]|uniref:M15 family metallopeptidase n=1 Tax=Porticoccus sp. W117 TaxID=3054777 RepID=UPI00259966EF|nr:D-alanyl-D-alanine carboxypeptidase family protein [Porticoccus sp. W117]MDM3871849.1 D-alanyl-D-alanine carboxypeptidase family protein [Porticoccus sp. W117]